MALIGWVAGTWKMSETSILPPFFPSNLPSIRPTWTSGQGLIRITMHYTVAYDITDDKRRNKVAKILKDFGTRIQYSVFECDTDRRALLRLQNRLQKVINLAEDTIIFYHLCAACEKQIDRIGIKKGLDEQSYIV